MQVQRHCPEITGAGVLVAFVLGRAWLRAPALNRAVGRLPGEGLARAGGPRGVRGWVAAGQVVLRDVEVWLFSADGTVVLGLTSSCPARPREGAVGSRGCPPGLTVRPQVWRPRTHMTFRTFWMCRGSFSPGETLYQRQRRGILRSFDL